MPVRSMTGYAQAKGRAAAKDGGIAFTLSLKAVNHRFLDLHMRMPADSDGLEMKLRRVIKEHMARGHVEVTLAFEREGEGTLAINRELVAGYVRAFRAAAKEFSIAAEPDLNAVLRIPGALGGATAALDEDIESSIAKKAEEAVAHLNTMREQEGSGLAQHLREHMARIGEATAEIERLREPVLRANVVRLQQRIRELVGSQPSEDRLLQEAAIAADRSDIHEEMARMKTHIDHFLGLLEKGGEVGKKLDFLLQEMNREANTLLSKTSGLTGEAMRITELGLRLKSEIEKSREQVQNLE
jgi:uncharacterized protein (TIGR00255 family)